MGPGQVLQTPIQRFAVGILRVLLHTKLQNYNILTLIQELDQAQRIKRVRKELFSQFVILQKSSRRRGENRSRSMDKCNYYFKSFHLEDLNGNNISSYFQRLWNLEISYRRTREYRGLWNLMDSFEILEILKYFSKVFRIPYWSA